MSKSKMKMKTENTKIIPLQRRKMAYISIH